MHRYSIHEGRTIVKVARAAVVAHLHSRTADRNSFARSLAGFSDIQGVFVRILHYPTYELRGCIGSINPEGPVSISVIRFALAAAFDDQRFVPISHVELGDTVIEVNLLSELEQISGRVSEIVGELVAGRDGVSIEYGFNRSLVLPAEAGEAGWSAEETLDNMCISAGLQKHIWRHSGVRLCKFTAQAFREVEPDGDVEEIRLAR
jgi:hypothetical protein